MDLRTCCSWPCPPVYPHTAAWTAGTAPCPLRPHPAGCRSSDTELLQEAANISITRHAASRSHQRLDSERWRASKAFQQTKQTDKNIL